jgi:murein L,D-transpeptidase YcbB/YkuD
VRLVRIRVVIRVLIVLSAVVASSCGADDRQIRDRIRAEVEAARAPEYATRNKDGRTLWTSIRDFYRARAFAPVWLHKRRATLDMERLIAAIKRADRDGLDPVLYDVALVDERGGHDRKRFSEDNVGEVDVRLTLAYMQLASDLADGVSDLARSHPAWHMRPQTFDAGAHLTRALADGKIAESLEALRPNNREYRVLAEHLADYRSRAGNGQSAAATDGIPLAERIKQIELNMERWRWLPREPAATYIVVNIPAFRLDVWERDTVVLSMRVVVGKKDTPTPIFNDSMTHIVFSPYWNVPPTIARDETLPSALRDPSFLRRTNMEVVDQSGQVVDADSIDLERAADYRFRQRPGSGNALGHVKFMFPNQFNVYLHDTPADSLFARASRSFSHGCVRVEEPQALAEHLLKGRAEWTSEAIATAMHAGDERTVKLAAPVPVYIGYWTADVTPDGKVAFVPDVYGLDARQAAAMDQRLARAKQPSRLSANAPTANAR